MLLSSSFTSYHSCRLVPVHQQQDEVAWTLRLYRYRSLIGIGTDISIIGIGLIGHAQWTVSFYTPVCLYAFAKVTTAIWCSRQCACMVMRIRGSNPRFESRERNSFFFYNSLIIRKRVQINIPPISDIGSIGLNSSTGIALDITLKNRNRDRRLIRYSLTEHAPLFIYTSGL